MTIVNTETGEIVEFDAAAAERRAERITLRLDAIAENYTRVLPMIREAIEKRDDIALGYRSPGDYVSDRFGQSLADLGVEVRREVVRELTDAGMSTRAIAPVVGTSHVQVAADRRSGVNPVNTSQSPESAHGGEAVTDSGQTSPARDADSRPSFEASEEGSERASAVPEPVERGSRPVVVGIDGKSYTPPTRRALSVVKPQSGDEQAIELVETIARNLTVLSQMAMPERRAALIAAWPKALGKVSPAQTDRFTPDNMRAVADGLHDLADEWSK